VRADGRIARGSSMLESFVLPPSKLALPRISVGTR
jgi:hypothetical protein